VHAAPVRALAEKERRLIDLVGFDPGSGGAYEWELAASGKHLDGTASGGFNLYNLVRNSSVVASLAVDAEMLVV
jgi:hypothetical protein